MKLSSVSLLIIIGLGMSQTSFSEAPVTRERGGTRHSESEGEEAGSARSSSHPSYDRGYEERNAHGNRNRGSDHYDSKSTGGRNGKDSGPQGADQAGPESGNRY